MFKDKNLDTIKMAKDIINGYNQNEVALVSKKSTKRVFLKSFFIFLINLYFTVIFVVFDF